MNTESIALVVNKIDELIKVAGGKIEGFYPYAVKQALIAGYLSLFGLCLCIISFMVGLALFFSNNPKIIVERYECRLSKTGVACIICGIISFVSIICCTVGSITFLAVFNPQYYAVKLLLGMIK